MDKVYKPVTTQYYTPSSKPFRITIIILILPFMQRILTYTPETNRVSGVYSVAAILQSHFTAHEMLLTLE
jgi:hypothetical protein